MLDQLLGGSKDSIISTLTSKLGIPADKAQGFVNKALGMIENALKSGKLDLSSLMGGNASSLLSKFDLSALEKFTGGDTGKAKQGLESVISQVMTKVKSDPKTLQKLTEQFTTSGKGGIMDSVGQMASKVFGKK